jgi:hypothetical protein
MRGAQIERNRELWPYKTQNNEEGAELRVLMTILEISKSDHWLRGLR